jgi:hypothetical protein
VRAAYAKSPDARQYVKDALGKVRALAVTLDLVPLPARLVWRVFGIWDEPRPGV